MIPLNNNLSGYLPGAENILIDNFKKSLGYFDFLHTKEESFINWKPIKNVFRNQI